MLKAMNLLPRKVKPVSSAEYGPKSIDQDASRPFRNLLKDNIHPSLKIFSETSLEEIGNNHLAELTDKESLILDTVLNQEYEKKR